MSSRRKRVTVVGASVVAPDKPTLTAPSDNAVVHPAVGVTVSATVTAGQVPDRVDFVLDPGASETIVVSDSTTPYSQTWTPSTEPGGSHTLVARFVYGSGHVDSDPINLTLNSGAYLVSIAEGAWVPADIHNDGSGKVDKWANSGTGGTNYDLLQGTAGARPTYSATGDRAGTGPAVTFVRATPTQLATVAFAIAQPFTRLFIAKTTSAANNQRLSDGRTGNTASLSQITNSANFSTDGTNVATVAQASTNYIGWACVANGASGFLRADAATQSHNIGVASSSGIVMGDFGTGGGAAWDGPVERGYHWNSALSTADIAEMFRYLGL